MARVLPDGHAAAVEPAPRAADRPAADRPVKSVERVVELLLAFSDQRPSLTLGEASRLMGVHKSSASRILRQLAATGILRRLPDSGGYGVGVRLFEIGSLFPVTNALARASAPFLQRLVQATEQTAQLCVPDDFDSVVIASEESHALIRAAANLGGRLPAAWTASGRLFLAHRSDDEIRGYLAATGAHRDGSPDRILDEVGRVRSDGVAVVEGEYRPELLSVAAPLHGPGGRLTGALCLVAALTEPARQALPHYRRTTVDLARELSGALGARSEA